MKIGITSQNFRTITGHAGKARRFLVYQVDEDGVWRETERLDLPKNMSLHEHKGGDHPVFAFDKLITAGCGEGFAHRLGSYGVQVIATSEQDPKAALQALIRGQPLPAALPHDHEHHQG